MHQAGVLIYHCMMHGNMKLKLCKDVLCVRIAIPDYYNLERNIWNSNWFETTRSRRLIFLSQGTHRLRVTMRRIKDSLLECHSSFQNFRQTMTQLRFFSPLSKRACNTSACRDFSRQHAQQQCQRSCRHSVVHTVVQGPFVRQ